MRHQSPHRRFVDPGNVDGIPVVSVSKPRPLRDVPLPGTKSMAFPVDGSLQGLIARRSLEKPVNSRTATTVGIAALAMALLLPCMVMFKPLSRILPWESGGMDFGAFLAFALVHLLSIFSQIVSSGRNLPGSIAIPVLYAGCMFWIVVDHFVS